MLVTDGRRAHLPLFELIEEAVAGGVDAVYLRDVAPPLKDLASLVRGVQQRAGDRAMVLVNGAPAVARACGTGLHLRERETDIFAARSLLLPGTLVGRSVHSVEAAIASAGADYVLAGHVYPSASKPGLRPLGLAGVTAIVAAAPCPTLAIGGITPERVAEVVLAGAAGVAVIGAIVEADDPRAAAASLCAALNRTLEEKHKESSMPDEATTTVPGRVEIIVNGKSVTVPAGATVHDFLSSKRMTDAMAIVERNGEIVARGDYPATPLQHGDCLEVVHAVGGG